MAVLLEGGGPNVWMSYRVCFRSELNILYPPFACNAYLNHKFILTPYYLSALCHHWLCGVGCLLFREETARRMGLGIVEKIYIGITKIRWRWGSSWEVWQRCYEFDNLFPFLSRGKELRKMPLWQLFGNTVWLRRDVKSRQLCHTHVFSNVWISFKLTPSDNTSSS